MDDKKPPMSGASEGLDRLMVRKMKQAPFDAAIVVWDLVPAWNPAGQYCRWKETPDFYLMLSRSKALPENWKKNARSRYDELAARANPGERKEAPRLLKEHIVAVCMEPMFEGLLIQDEPAVKRALGVTHQRIPDWPGDGWGNNQERRPDNAVLRPALSAVRKLRPAPSETKMTVLIC